MSLQLGIFGYQPPPTVRPDPRFVVVRDGQTFERAIRELAAQPALTFDFETSGLAWYHKARAIGLAAGYMRADGYIQNFYFPFRHATGEVQLDFGSVAPAIKALLEAPTFKVGHHLKFDCHIARVEGWRVGGVYYDTMIAAHFHDENRAVALKYRAERDLRDPEAGFWENQVDLEIVRLAKQQRMGVTKYKSLYGYSQLPVELCGLYAAHDVEYTTRLWWLYEVKHGISKNYPRAWGTEQRLIPVLVDMEQDGVDIDTWYLEDLRSRISQHRDIVGEQIGRSLYPYRLNIGSDDDLRRYLVNVLRLPMEKRTKTDQLSVDYEALEPFKDKVPVVGKILEWRDADKIASTYTNSILDRLDANRVLHCNFKQIGTLTGRLACSEPNLQNIPSDDDDRAVAATGLKLKEGGVDPWSVKASFKVPNGFQRLYFDYSQIELRVLAYYSGDAIMREVYANNGDIHERTAMEVFGNCDSDAIRRRSKIINFGLSYCLSAKGFSRQTKMPLQASEEFMARFFERYHGIAKFRPYFWAFCRAQGNRFVNLFNRPRQVHNLTSYDEYERGRAERQAIGSLIQGTAAELTKESLVRIHDWIRAENVPAILRLTIHDEIQLDVEISEVPRVAARVRTFMESYPEFAPIPILVDASMSATNWRDKKKFKIPT